VVGGDQVRVDRQPQDAQADVDVVPPDRCVPVGRAALEALRAPDVVDQNVRGRALPLSAGRPGRTSPITAMS
jgi:hypothetical protein